MNKRIRHPHHCTGVTVRSARQNSPIAAPRLICNMARCVLVQEGRHLANYGQQSSDCFKEVDWERLPDTALNRGILRLLGWLDLQSELIGAERRRS